MVTVQSRDDFVLFSMTSADLERNGLKMTSGKSVDVTRLNAYTVMSNLMRNVV